MLFLFSNNGDFLFENQLTDPDKIVDEINKYIDFNCIVGPINKYDDIEKGVKYFFLCHASKYKKDSNDLINSFLNKTCNYPKKHYMNGAVFVIKIVDGIINKFLLEDVNFLTNLIKSDSFDLSGVFIPIKYQNSIHSIINYRHDSFLFNKEIINSISNSLRGFFCIDYFLPCF